MTPLALDLPEDKSQWPAWFEHQLLGSDLRLLVRQMELLAGQTTALPDGVTWEELLRVEFSDLLPKILSSGLSSLSPGDLQRLIRKPRLLLALQECVFTDGGEYWRNFQRSDASAQSIKSHQDRFVQEVERQTVRLATSQEAIGSNSSILKTLLFVASLAATILLAVFFLRPASNGRYFARAGLLTTAAKGNDFCKTLASAIREDWDPNATDAVFRRQLQDLKDSCERLIDAELPQLDAKVASDLRTRCTKWQSSLSDMLVQIDSGRSLADVQREANELVDRLVKVLGELG
jgi:hypothetical protein